MNSNTKLKWRTDLDKQVIIQNFEKRGWIKSQGEGGKCTCYDIYLVKTTGIYTGRMCGL